MAATSSKKKVENAKFPNVRAGLDRTGGPNVYYSFIAIFEVRKGVTPPPPSTACQRNMPAW